MHEIELIWHGLTPPYTELFAWLEGRAEKPSSSDPAPFRPLMLAHAIEETDLAALDPADYLAEWKWDGIRVQASAERMAAAPVPALFAHRRRYLRGFPDLVEALRFEGALDGELLVVREGRVQTFNELQQRLNRKTVTPKLIAEFPAHIRVYDILFDGDEDMRARPLLSAARGSKPSSSASTTRASTSRRCPFATWDELAAARADPARGAGEDAGHRRRHAQAPRRALRARPAEGPVVQVEARSLHRRRGADVRPARQRQALVVLFRLHLRRLDAGDGGDVLVPVGKAYFGFTDEELAAARPICPQQHRRAVRPGARGRARANKGLVLEVAFEGLQRSTRHKSGVAMRFPRISRLRWDKPPGEADRLETLEALLDTRAPSAAPKSGDRLHFQEVTP